MDVWVCSHDDIDEGIRIAKTRYPFMDVESSTAWAHRHIDSQKLSIMRTENVVSCVVYDYIFWEPGNLRANMVFFAGLENANVWEPYKLVKAQLARSVKNGCKSFTLGSITGIDLGPFARRLGLKNVGPNYCAEF